MNSPALSPMMDATTTSGLIYYRETLLNQDYSPTVSRIVDCIDFILEQSAEAQHG